MSVNELSEVAYKKGNWMRYTLWALGAICITVLIFTFITMMTNEISVAVPEGYNFAVTDNYTEGSNIRTTYYVYDNKIFVEDESYNRDEFNRSVMIYDDINTSSLEYDAEDKINICELGVCSLKPKVLASIKRLISRRIGREYIGL